MATKVFMEALSPTMEEGRLVKWHRNEGDAVKSGDVLAEVETDKAVMELVARGDGVLRKRLVAEGATAPVGQLVGVIAGANEDIGALVADAGAAAPAAAAAAPPPAPKAAPAAAAAPSPAPAPAPKPAPVPAAPGMDIDPASEQAPHAAESDGTRSSPLARRLAREGGLDLAGLRGTGPSGRIIKRDVEAALSAPRVAAPAARAPQTGADFEDVALTQIRKTIAKRLSESIGPIPTFYLTAEFDLTRVSELRGAMTDFGDEYKVSVNDVVLKAVATALALHPECNAHWLGDRIRYHRRVHLGMAVATDDGLIVPVIFDADQKRMSEISAEAKGLAKRARERKLKPEEYTGSTFSVSNLGMFGIDQFTAIINPPECGILAIGAVEEKPVLADGATVWRKKLRVTMSCDHRVIDGAVGAKFLQTLRRLLENPLMLVY
ncbi:MAG TPA: dihydrolipoamide acetyltransferase family protein [Gemmatimonadaceae bacterium]|nr:dihydrolipoamide acetyltransferase family protein [Gemmatimonadaceae bacterium]